MKSIFPPIIAAIVLSITFIGLGSVKLFDVDEAVFAEATREMVQSGNLITPTYNGENRYDKPILFYWLMAASYELFGINEFAARFPSALGGILLCLAMYLMVLKLFDKKDGLYAVVVMALSPFFFIYSHAAVTDMVLTLFITLSLFSFYLSLNQGRRYIYGLYLFSALAFLTKGLIGVVFPFGIAAAYVLFSRKPGGIKNILSPVGIFIFLLVSAPWYSAQIAVNGREFIREFFIKHHFMRYTGVISGHRGPLYYYLPVLIAGLFPWISFMPGGIRNVFAGKESLPGNGKGGRRDFLLFCFIWFVFVLAFFSFSVTKLPNYILPALPAASILVLSGMDTWERFANISMGTVSLLLSGTFLILGPRLAGLGINDPVLTYGFALIALSLAIAGFYSLLSRKRLYGVMALLTALFLSVMSFKALPYAGDYLQGTLYRYSIYAKDNLPDKAGIITYGINNPSIVFYSGRNIVEAGSRKDLLPYIGKGGEWLAISKTRDAGDLTAMGFDLLKKDGRYALLEKKG